MHTVIPRFLLAIATIGIAAGCDSADGVASNERVPRPNQGISDDLVSLVHALAGNDVSVVRIFDREGSRFALGVERGAPTKAVTAAASDAVPPLLLLVIDSAARTANWPLGAERAFDAALASDPGVVGYVDAGGRPCVQAGWAPSCVAANALPVGIDVTKDGQIVWSAVDTTGTHLYVSNPGGGAPRRLTTGPDLHTRALFSPDGSRVAFVGTGNGLAALWEVEIANGAVTQLTNVGLTLLPAGSDQRVPKEFVPPPLARASMRWDTAGIHYAAQDGGFRVDPKTGTASKEEVPR